MRVNPLSRQEKDAVWKQVCLGMAITPQKTSHRSRNVSSIFKKSTAITLIFGMTMGTAFAADGAKPGDVLFPLDRAMENAHLSLVPDDKKDELKVKFALERVDEVKEIFSEITPKTKTSLKTEELPPEVISNEPEPEKDPPADGRGESTEIPDIPTESVDEPKIEVADNDLEETTDVNEDVDEDTDEDLPKNPLTKQTDEGVENPPTDGEEVSTETAATTTDENNNSEDTNDDVPEETIDEIGELTEILQGDVEMSDADKKRIELALGTALDFLSDVKGELAEQGNVEAASSIDNLLKELNDEIETLPENITFEVKLSPSKQKVQFEITSEDDKDVVQIVEVPADKDDEKNDGAEKLDEVPAPPKETKLEIKDGTLSIKTEDDEDDSLATEANVEETTDDENPLSDGKETGTTTPDSESKDSPAGAESSGEVKPTTAVGSGEVKQSTTTEDILDDGLPVQTDEEDDGTTTVKVIIKKLDEDLEFSVTDQDGDLHDIIEEYTDEKGDA